MKLWNMKEIEVADGAKVLAQVPLIVSVPIFFSFPLRRGEGGKRVYTNRAAMC